MNQILEELKSREPIFHHPNRFGRTRQDILDQMHEDFWEVGASGAVYTREVVVAVLLERYADKQYRDIWETKDFSLSQISPHDYLLTYVLIQDGTRTTRRSTWWHKKEGKWKIRYHQGTIVQNW